MPDRDETSESAHEPLWPSADHDEAPEGGSASQPAPGTSGATSSAGGGAEEVRQDSGATTELPIPGAGSPQRPTIPAADSAQQPTIWVRRPERPSAPPSAPLPPSAPPAQPSAGHAMPMRIEPRGGPSPGAAPTPAARPQPNGPPPGPGGQIAQPAQPEPPSAHPAEPAGQGSEPRPSETKRKRKKTPLLVGTALLVIIAVGVVLALPPVSNRLGLPWAPHAPKAAPPEPAAVSTALHGPSDSGPAPTPAGVGAAMAGPAGQAELGTLTGSVIDPSTGAALWDQDSGRALTPASTTKLLTASAALLAVGHNTQLSTRAVAGSEPGTVVLVGGGDPTLSSLPVGQDSIYPEAAHLDDLVAQVKQASQGEVSTVRMDLGAYAGPATAPGWAPEDAPSTYAAPVAPAMLDGARSSPTDEKSPRVNDPAGTLAQEFADRLGAGTAGPSRAAQPGRVLGEVRSAPLPELIDTALTQSDNVLADAIGRQTAIARGAEPSFAGAAKATVDVLAENGFDTSGVQLSDGSGLSTLNKVPARLLSQLLSVAAAPDGKDPRTAKLRPLLAGLPVAGGSGTLADRYTSPPADAGKGWVRAKTGTLSGVNTEAGVVLDADGRVLVFALMSASQSDLEAVRGGLDNVAAALRACGCH